MTARIAFAEVSADALDPQRLAGILADFTEIDGVHALGVSHRIGSLAVGDVAMVAVVAAEHRGQGFTTISALVDAIKERLPIWKHQSFEDGQQEWVGLPR